MNIPPDAFDLLTQYSACSRNYYDYNSVCVFFATWEDAWHCCTGGRIVVSHRRTHGSAVVEGDG